MRAGVAWGLALLASAATLMAQETVSRQPELLALERFFLEPRIEQVTLSPAGDRVAYLLREPHGMSIGSLVLATGERTRHLDSRLVRRLAWSTSGRGLFLETAKQVAYLPLDRPANPARAYFVVALDPLREQRYRGVDPVLPDHVLVTEKEANDDYRLLRHDTGGGLEVLLSSPSPIRRFVLDASGRVTYIQHTVGTEVIIDQIDAHGDRREVLRCAFAEACRLLDGAPLSEVGLLLEQRLDGGRWGLVWFDVTAGATTEQYQDPRALADLDTVVLDPQTRLPLLAVHHSERRRHVGLTPGAAAHLAHIEAALPGRDLYLEPRTTGPFWLVIERGSRTQHPRFYRYDTAAHTSVPLLEDERSRVDSLPAARLVQRRPITYRARDGMLIHGFLSLPAGMDLASAPLVAKIHGGPWNHVQSGYDGLTQFLVNRGYIVFEPNFRGSTGFGLDYMLAARGEFGDGRVHQDIVDGVAFLTASGLGDRARVAILGHSFGGFSALGGVAFSPDVFRAALASAPAIDLVRSLRDIDGIEGFLFELRLEEALNLLLVDPNHPDGSEAEMTRLRRQSPEARLADTTRPVLILAGGRDQKIDIVDVKHYAATLAALGKDVSLLVDDEVGHGFESPRLRRAYFVLAERFLGAHLGGAVGARAERGVGEYIEGHLRLKSESLAAVLASNP